MELKRELTAVGLVALLLAACSAEVHIDSKPAVQVGTPARDVAPFKVPLMTEKGTAMTVTAIEVCIDGAVYIVTETGGITAKVNPRHGRGVTAGYADSPFVECK